MDYLRSYTFFTDQDRRLGKGSIRFISVTLLTSFYPLIFWTLIVLGLYGIAGCGNAGSSKPYRSFAGKSVAVLQRGDSSVLFRNGQPYFIKGAGGESRLKRLRECGGNSVRIWNDNDADRILNQASQFGLSVFFGLWIERERDGFTYYDDQAINRQFEQIRRTVVKYRNHPALLMWCVGNEWNLKAKNIYVYDEVNRIAKLIHQLDPNHPVTTSIGSNRPQTFQIIKERCPEIDILSINVYGGIHELEGVLQKSEWTKPYVLSEFGPLGHWESERTDWGVPLEPDSYAKCAFIRTNYQRYIGSHPPNCLGSYVFLWGFKEEGTHTWYSFFDEKGRETALVETMQSLWTGKAPDNRAPIIRKVLVDQKAEPARSFPLSGAVHWAQVEAFDPEGDALTYRWEVRPQAEQRLDYDYHDTPLLAINGLISAENSSITRFSLPHSPGEYRLFIHVYDTHNHVATANIPLEITSPVNHE